MINYVLPTTIQIFLQHQNFDQVNFIENYQPQENQQI
jgi:hypothetical protein